MRNFPHQINRIEKLRAALQVCEEIIIAGRDPGDDGAFGFEVARRGIYAFRGVDSNNSHDIDRAIRREQLKPLANQGPRTFARDLRRTLDLLGFLVKNPLGAWEVTPSGQQLLALPDPPNPESTQLWTQHLLDAPLGDATNGVSHPAVNMLRLITKHPGMEKRKLAFTLEMEDDSEEEFRKAEHLATQDFDAALASINATAYQAANAVKILPSLLEQLGLLRVAGNRCWNTDESVSALGAAHPNDMRREFGLRRPRQGRIVNNPGEVSDGVYSPGRPLTTEAQLHAALRLQERTAKHQNLVRRVITRLTRAQNIRTSEDSFDILATFANQMLLIEAKTVRDDGLVQARLALGQLLFYEYFDVAPIANGKAIQRIAAFDLEPGQIARDFLRQYGVACLVSTPQQLEVAAEVADFFQT